MYSNSSVTDYCLTQLSFSPHLYTLTIAEFNIFTRRPSIEETPGFNKYVYRFGPSLSTTLTYKSLDTLTVELVYPGGDR